MTGSTDADSGADSALIPNGLNATVKFALRNLLGMVSALVLCFQSAGGSELPIEPDVMMLKRSVISNYAAIASAVYRDSLATIKDLKRAVDTFLDNPSTASLDAARAAWRVARVPYCQSEVYRFYDGPIDQVEGMINAWPIDENYIDYVAEDANAGIINAVSSYPVLTPELISTLNEKEGKKNISTGFHAIEFLLWGQDRNPNGPGNRSWQDYATGGAKNFERRRQYLRIATDLLVEQLETVASAWAEGSSTNYRSQFQSMDPDVALANILKGLGALSGPELAGERMTVPYETKEQEDEHSCFSDNTRDDLVYDAVGIQNVYLGRYVDLIGRKVEGRGVHDLLTRLEPKLATKLAEQIETTVKSIRAIPQPFDQAILGPNTAPGRIAIKKGTTSAQAQSDLIAKAAKALSIKLNI